MTLIEDQISFYNVRRSGAEYNAATLLSTIADLGTIECVAYLPKGMEDDVTIWTIDQNVTFPENISVLIPCGVMLHINADVIIAFEGPCFNQCPNWYEGPGQIVLKSKTAVNSQSYSDFFNPFVVFGGIHGLSPTCYSPNFNTGAYVANGQYIVEDLYSIRYGDLGANCADDTVWVIISNFDVSTIPGTNFIRVPGTHYYIDYVSTTIPILPPDSAPLMEVHLLADQIVQVNDLRSFDAIQGMLNRVLPVQWTPILAPGTFGYDYHFGQYLRLGKLLHLSGAIRVNFVSGVPDSALTITGLPFEDYAYNFGGFIFTYFTGVKPLQGFSNLAGVIYPDQRHITVLENVMGGFSGYLSAARLRNTFECYFTGTYLVEP